jgi:hypothetical protein
MVALDDYFKPGETVNLIKLDVQGYELHALRGAQRVLHENTGIELLFEFWPYGLKQAGAEWIDLLTSLEQHGFVVRQLCKDGLKALPLGSVEESPEWYVNLFASRP